MAAKKFTEEERLCVLNLVNAGVTQDVIARVFKTNVSNLSKQCREVLDDGMATRNATVVSKLYELCMKGDKTALIFWCKAQMGWRDRPEVQVSVSDVQPMINVTINKLDGPKKTGQQIETTGTEYLPAPQARLGAPDKGD